MSDSAVELPEASAPGRPPMARAGSLDALRGLAILLMCLSGLLPGALPNCMYHGYYPTSLPGTLLVGESMEIEAGPGNDLGEWEPVAQKKFRGDWPAYTWVDWVFPAFLFAMGAAIPLSQAARRGRGMGRGRLLGGVFARFGMLVAFAVYAQQVTPYFMENPPSVSTWWLALGAMLPAGLAFGLFPRTWPAGLRRGLRAAGWVGGIGLVALAQSRSEKPFSWNDKDIILLLLAWSSLLVSLATLVAGRWAWLRLLMVLPIAGLAHHQAMRPGWRVFGERFDPWMAWLQAPKDWLDRSAWSGPLPDRWLDFSGLYDFTWIKFAGIVVCGTLIGDAVLRWQRRSAEAAPQNSKNSGHELGEFFGDVVFTVLLLAAVVGSFVGLKDYASTLLELGGVRLSTPYATLVISALPAALALAWCLLKKRNDIGDGAYLTTLTAWGTGFLVAGVVLAMLPGPVLDTAFAFFEGGIKKGPPAALSWYLVSLGGSVLLLTAGAVWIDVRGVRWPWGWLIANGRNPMLAYLGIRNLLAPLVALPLLFRVGDDGPRSLNAWMLSRVFDDGPWSAAMWGVVQTLGLALIVWGLTRRRVVWRV